MSVYLMPALAVGLLIGAADKDDFKKEKEKLQGSWKVVMFEKQGKSTTDTEDQRLIVDGDNFSVKKGDETIIKGTIKLDPSKSPKEIDLKITEDKEGKHKGETVQGIYSLDGDALKWCLDHPGGTDRPKEFSALEGTKQICIRLKREKS